MEKTTNTQTNNNLILKNRKYITLDGINQIISSNENNIFAKLKDTSIYITGNQIHITRLDIEQGILEAEGIFDSIKYGKSTNIFKRIFK